MTTLNKLLLDTGSPPIPAMRARFAAYDGQAGPAIDLSQAAPGDPPAPVLLRALGGMAADPRYAGYGPLAGDMALRTPFAAELSRLYAARIDPAEIAITAGCNQAFLAAMLAVARAGDAVLLPTPWYFNHAMALSLLGIEARPLPCSAEAGFVPDPDDAARLIDSRVRAIVLVTPNNPTGAIYPAETIAAFAELCRSRDIFLVLDETYVDFLPDAAAPPHALFQGEWQDRLLRLSSFSKSYAIPGHRLGSLIAGRAVQAELGKILDTVQICPPRSAQAALAQAMPHLAAWREENRAEMVARAAACREALGGLNGWRVESVGAYFAYVRLPPEAPDAWEAAGRLADLGLLALPGPAFGPAQERHLRLAFANVSRARIPEIPARLAALSLAEGCDARPA